MATTRNDDLWPRGLEVTEVRPITKAEMEAEGWEDYGQTGAVSVIVFSDGSKVYPSQDPEGNGPGCLFGALSNGTAVRI